MILTTYIELAGRIGSVLAVLAIGIVLRGIFVRN